MLFPRRRLIICLALCTLCLAGWVRSHYHADTLFHVGYHRRTGVGLLAGGFVLFDLVFSGKDATEPDPLTPGLQYDGPKFGDRLHPNPDFMAPIHGFHLSVSGIACSAMQDTVPTVQIAFVAPAGTRIHIKQTNQTTWPPAGSWIVITGAPASGRIVRIPFWFLTLLTLTPLLPPLLRRLRSRNPHACPACGYDLRATPDRCPECGLARSPGRS